MPYTYNPITCGLDYYEKTTVLSGTLKDHGDLTGLSSDDHTQYHTDTRGDTRYHTKTDLDNGQLDNRYYTEIEIDTFSGTLQADINTKLELDNGNLNIPGNIEIIGTGWGIFPNRVGVGTVPNLTGDALQINGSIAAVSGYKLMNTPGVVDNVWYSSGNEDINIIRNFNNIATLWTLRSRTGNPVADNREATLSLVRTNGAGNEEFFDLYNNGYHTNNNVQHGIRIQKRGTGEYRNFFFDFYDGTNITEIIKITPSGLNVIGTGNICCSGINTETLKIKNTYTPTTSSGTGDLGDICWDNEYIYICIDTNTWKRSVISTW